MTHFLPRLAILNILAFAALTWAWQLGYVKTAFAADTSHISYAIVVLLAVGLLSAWVVAVSIHRDFRHWSALPLDGERDYLREIHLVLASAYRDWASRFATIATWLAALGMLGTVVGLVQMAFSLRGMDLTSPDNLAAVLTEAFNGYGTALITTAVGLVAAVWVEANALVIERQASGYYRTVELPLS